MPITCVRPEKRLRRFVEAYVVVDHLADGQTGARISTVPMPFGALSVNYADRSLDDAGNRHPEIGILGLQTRLRHWTPGTQTRFAMVLLTPAGMIRAFGGQGGAVGDRLVDLGDIWGRERATGFLDAAASGIDGLDTWAASVLGQSEDRESILIDALSRHGRPSSAASAMGVSLRTFERRFRRALGVTPTELLNLQRMQRSLMSVHTSNTTPEEAGFADRSHAIRHWRRFVGTPPGRYGMNGPSDMARRMAAAGSGMPVFYL